jgi:Lrp/AsnC family transcriptional regulator for asnA, asnC and gidA
MEKLDLKDRKILYHLDIDSRQSFASIGKKVGLHKDSVADRVKKLIEKGIIRGFFTVIDYSKIGLNAYRFYFSFLNITPKLKKDGMIIHE